jgi:hypothetical protein
MVSEPMIDQTFHAKFPDGSPTGEGWVEAPEFAEIWFPFDGSICYESSQGRAGPVSSPAILGR